MLLLIHYHLLSFLDVLELHMIYDQVTYMLHQLHLYVMPNKERTVGIIGMNRNSKIAVFENGRFI